MIDVLGLDLSPTSTGLASDRGTWVIASKVSGLERVDEIARGVLGAARTVDVVVMEGAAFSRNLAHARTVTELTGVVKYWLWREGVPIALVNPMTLKKFAGVKKGGGKAGMGIAAAAYPDFDGHTSDEADAFLLRQMGLLAYSPDVGVLDPLPRYQREALNTVVWPVLERQAVPA